MSINCGARWWRCAALFPLLLLAASAAAERTTPALYLESLPKPRFAAGHKLPPLTRFGHTLPFDARVELAQNWGYALEFGPYATGDFVDRELANPLSISSRICTLAASDPKRFPLAVICSRDMPQRVPEQTWTRDASGKPVDGKQLWSPEAPDSVFEAAGASRAEPLKKIAARAPIAIVLNGGEYALTVSGFGAKAWSQDPRIMKAKGGQAWYEYASERKAHQELIISKAVREAVPNRLLYIFYTTGGGKNRNFGSVWQDWGFGFEWMRNVSDLPSNESYFEHFNTGWTGKQDVLTMALNSAGFEISMGAPLSYNWLCAGWPREKLADGGLADIPTYMGFLKCYYTIGMIGGNAGYYAYPPNGFGAVFDSHDPPHWLRQMIALSRVHALFSHLEGFLRDGYLLPGPDRHRWSKDQPAYEFPTGQSDVRVLARKMRFQPQWLITAWAADGKDRPVSVTIPQLGQVSLRARACGSVYRATLRGGKPALELVDVDGLLPTEQGK